MKKKLHYLFIFCAILIGMEKQIEAQTTLSAGDVVILEFNGNGTDGFTFMPLVNLQAGTKINFTDYGWNGTAIWTAEEGTTIPPGGQGNMITYTAPSAITAGTLIRQNTANISGSAFTEDLDFSSYNFNHLNYIYALNSLNTGHDGILVFQGSASDPRFIWAYHTGQWGKGSYADYYWSNLPTGLTNGTNAVYFPDNSSWSDVTVDDGYYSGDKTAADAATWRLRVANSANWTTSSSTTTVPALLYSAGASYIVTAAPTVTTQAVSAIGSTSANGNGNISNTGGVNVTERGVYWSTTDGFANGTGTKVSTTGNWSVTGDFTQPITGLTPNITYYVKAFATNSVGTSYGEQVSFATGIGTDVNNASLNALSIYPNPAVNGFTVNVGEKTSTVSIYNMSGCLVLTQQANKETYIDISSLQRGVYLVKANEWVGKLVKK